MSVEYIFHEQQLLSTKYVYIQLLFRRLSIITSFRCLTYPDVVTSIFPHSCSPPCRSTIYPPHPIFKGLHLCGYAITGSPASNGLLSFLFLLKITLVSFLLLDKQASLLRPTPFKISFLLGGWQGRDCNWQLP